MREKKTFAQRAKVLASDETRRKYFLIYEGTNTEQIYFEAVNEYRDMIGINPLIELVPLIRGYSESGWSNPQKILDRVLQDLEDDRNGRITYERMLNDIMAYLEDEGVIAFKGISAATVWNRLKTFCIEEINTNLDCEVENPEAVCRQLAEELSINKINLARIAENISDIISEGAITYDNDFDKICFIIDRDKDSFLSSSRNNQYAYVLNECRERGFGFYLSNPCFEFWLLLHFDKVFDLDKEKLLKNEKVSSSRRYAEYELRKVFPGFHKSHYRPHILMQNIDQAIKNEKSFCEDEEKLENMVGSRVGLLIEEMKNV